MISEYKALARAALHEGMSEPASYTSRGGVTYPTAEQIEAGLSLTVRWHTRLKIIGERSSEDAGIIEGVNRLVFNSDQLDALDLTLERLGTVAVPGLDQTFRLDQPEESDGPLNRYWSVIQL